MKLGTKLIALLLVLAGALFFTSCGSSKQSRKISRYQEKTYIKLKEELPEATVTIVNDSIKVLFPNHLLFKTGSADLNESVNVTFERFGKVLNKYDRTKILINGYTDNTGNREFNKQLSQKRADNTLVRLVQAKVDNGRLYAWGHGETNPLGSNETESGREKNRRVEFIVLYAID